MLRKTSMGGDAEARYYPASMRPQRNAAENFGGGAGQVSRTVGFNEAAA